MTAGRGLVGLRRPPALRPGDRIAAITPSWAGPAVFPDRYDAGVRQLEAAFDVEVVELPGTRAPEHRVADDVALRLDDLHAAYADPSIAGIVATIGGDDAIRLLPHLDVELLRANPKVLLGYSDTQNLLFAVTALSDTVTFFGPSVLSGFGESAGLHRYLERGVRGVLFDGDAPLLWPEDVEGWTVEFQDWDDPSHQATPRPLRPPVGRRWSGGSDPVEGPLVAGCLEILELLRGTPWWLDLDGAILAIETSEEAPPPDRVAWFLRWLHATGQLERLGGLLFGRPGGADLPVEHHAAYDAAIHRVVVEEAGLADLMVVSGLEFGHTDPMWTLPIGVPFRLDPTAREITQLEPAVTAHPDG
jgi:muramoyltetrapeptide carboxypeptidase LdcA involved in peptidoglycan recycling